MGQRISNRGEPCTRSLDEQARDRSGAARPSDHLRLERFELLGEPALTELRTRFAELAAELESAEASEARRAEQAEHDAQARADLDGEGEACPALTTAVCLACGAAQVVTTLRPWPVDRAMLRAGLSEREVLAVVALLAGAYQEVRDEPPHLDALLETDLRRLSEMADQGASPREVRDLLGDPQSEPRLTAKALEQLLRDRR